MITRIKIENFKSIAHLEREFGGFNVIVGQNNHGKTNIFDAVNWFFSGFAKGQSKEDLICRTISSESEILVEIEFSGLQEAISNLASSTKKSALKKIFGNDLDTVRVRRTTASESGKKRELFNPEKDEWENTMGADNTWNDLLPHLEYVHTRVRLEDVGAYKSKSPIAEMLSGVLASIVAEDPKYVSLKEDFQNLFGDEESKVRAELDLLGSKVAVYLQKQFPDDAKVTFNVEIPVFSDFLKRFSTSVDDGVETDVEDKGDGMQRAVMLAIIQAYAEFRKENKLAKEFVFLIDEAELHLHPSAQRALKAALTDISSGSDQVFVNTHSSVLVTDYVPGQRVFQAEKKSGQTGLEEVVAEEQKMDVVFDLLGGSPADLLLPRNFVIVEGNAEAAFLQQLRSRFYREAWQGIKVLLARGDMKRQRETFHAIHEAYKPLFAEDGIYKNTTVILCDAPNSENRKHYDAFVKAHPWTKENNQVHALPVGSIEEYYPAVHRKTEEEVKAMTDYGEKVSLAVEVGKIISQEEFENEMPAIFEVMKIAAEKRL